MAFIKLGKEELLRRLGHLEIEKTILKRSLQSDISLLGKKEKPF